MQDHTVRPPQARPRLYSSFIECRDVRVVSSVAKSLGPGSVDFLVIGDFGRDGMCCQRDVAQEMALALRSVSAVLLDRI